MFEKYIERQAQYELSKNKIEMSDHSINSGDSMGAIVSFCATLLWIFGLGTIALVIAIASGSISIIINWDKFTIVVKNKYQKVRKGFKNKNKLP